MPGKIEYKQHITVCQSPVWRLQMSKIQRYLLYRNINQNKSLTLELWKTLIHSLTNNFPTGLFFGRFFLKSDLTFQRCQCRATPSSRLARPCGQRRRRSDGGCVWSVSSSAAPSLGGRAPHALRALPPCCSPRRGKPPGWCSRQSRPRNKPAPHLKGWSKIGTGWPGVQRTLLLKIHYRSFVLSRAGQQNLE